MDMLVYTLLGAAIGFIVGLTGVGGGSLMTPLLLMFGFPATTVIGTDLLYAAITKASGVVKHHKQGTVNWHIAKLMMLGSLPASLATTAVLHQLQAAGVDYTRLLTMTLGIMLTLTSIVLIFRERIIGSRVHSKHTLAMHPTANNQKKTDRITLLTGIALGTLVTLSSIGAGAFGAAALLLLYPAIRTIKVIGTDLAHAVPLTAIAGVGYMILGQVDYVLLFSLLIGSIPAIHVGTHVANRLPEQIVQPLLGGMLLVLGLKYTFT